MADGLLALIQDHKTCKRGVCLASAAHTRRNRRAAGAVVCSSHLYVGTRLLLSEARLSYWHSGRGSLLPRAHLDVSQKRRLTNETGTMRKQLYQCASITCTLLRSGGEKSSNPHILVAQTCRKNSYWLCAARNLSPTFPLAVNAGMCRPHWLRMGVCNVPILGPSLHFKL